MWQTVRQFSEKNHVSPSSVYQRVKTKSLLSKKEKNVLYVAELDDADVKQQTEVQEEVVQQVEQADGRDLLYQDELKRKLELENALKAQKLKNLQQDTIIKKQKQMYTKELYRQQYVEGVFEAFTQSFSNIKNLIIELKLKKEDNNKFKRVFSECLKKFQINLKKYLAQADKKQMQQQQDQRK